MARLAFKPVKGGVALHTRVTPNARANAISGFYADANGDVSLKVATTAQPEKGKANKAVIALLAKQFGCSKSTLEVTAGQTQRNKSVLIKGDEQEIKRWLIPYLETLEDG